MDEVGTAIHGDGDIYRLRAAAVWKLGVYLERHKFRWLRYRYLAFSPGSAGAVPAQFAYWVTR